MVRQLKRKNYSFHFTYTLLPKRKSTYSNALLDENRFEANTDAMFSSSCSFMSAPVKRASPPSLKKTTECVEGIGKVHFAKRFQKSSSFKVKQWSRAVCRRREYETVIIHCIALLAAAVAPAPQGVRHSFGDEYGNSGEAASLNDHILDGMEGFLEPLLNAR